MKLVYLIVEIKDDDIGQVVEVPPELDEVICDGGDAELVKARNSLCTGFGHDLAFMSQTEAEKLGARASPEGEPSLPAQLTSA